MTIIERPRAVTKTPLNERTIARALAIGFFARKYLVMVPNCNWTGHECDLFAASEIPTAVPPADGDSQAAGGP